MQYDRIKHIIKSFIGGSVVLRKVFYLYLNLFFLRAWYVRKEIKKFFENKKDGKVSVLDAGTGFGQYSYFIAKKFKPLNITAVDINAEVIESNRNFINRTGLKNIKFEPADLTKMKYQNIFDLAICVDVIEHIKEDTLVLKNLHSALKDGGTLILTTPSEKSEPDIEEHVRNGYSIDELKSKLKTAGFKDISIKYTYGKFGSLSWKLIIKIPGTFVGRFTPLLILLPFYYLFTAPIAFVLMWLDTKVKNETGTGLLVAARKN